MVILICNQCGDKIIVKDSSELKEIIAYGCLCDNCLKELFEEEDFSDEFRDIN